MLLKGLDSSPTHVHNLNTNEHERFLPTQCVWWGHPVTPSTGAIDHFLSLDVELEEGQDGYLEQMVRMDFLNTAYFKQVL